MTCGSLVITSTLFDFLWRPRTDMGPESKTGGSRFPRGRALINRPAMFASRAFGVSPFGSLLMWS
jgi:hypothetical protein